MAQDLAYSDVRRAFEVFLSNSPPERPIVLVGHNQGASHVQRLLADYFVGEENTANMKRLAVAYIIDFPLPKSALEGPLQGTPICQDGLLLTDKPRSRSLRRPLKVGGKFRTLPSNLFYEDLRLNSIQRVESLIEANILPRRAKLLEDYEVLEIEEAPVGDIIDVDKL